MSVQSDLEAIFAEEFLTNPITSGAQSTRGYFDHEHAIADVDGVPVQFREPVFRIRTGSLTNLAVGGAVTIGAVGAASASGGTSYKIAPWSEEEDGLVTVIPLKKTGS